MTGEPGTVIIMLQPKIDIDRTGRRIRILMDLAGLSVKDVCAGACKRPERIPLAPWKEPSGGRQPVCAGAVAEGSDG